MEEGGESVRNSLGARGVRFVAQPVIIERAGHFFTSVLCAFSNSAAKLTISLIPRNCIYGETVITFKHNQPSNVE